MSIIDKVLELAKSKTDSAEVFYSVSERIGTTWSSDKLKLAEGKETSGIALRVVTDGKVGFFATSRLDDPAMIVDTACELAKFGTEFAGEFVGDSVPAKIDNYHEETANISAATLVETGNRIVGASKERNPEAFWDSKLERITVDSTLANSNGARVSFKKAIFDGHLFAQVTREGDVLMLYEFDESTTLTNQPDTWVEILAKKLSDAKTIVKLPGGEYPCILTPKALNVIGPVRMAMNARMVTKDLSPWKDKVGERVFDSRIDLYDNGLDPTQGATQPVDDEGVTSRVTPLIEGGVLKGFIHDLHTAAIMGVAPTGNGMRMGLGGPPRASFTTLTMKPGKKSLDEMISGIDKGVLIDQVMGAHQASMFSGDFSVSVSLGFVIENGKIIGRFKDGMLAGNVFRMFKDQVVEFGSEMKSADIYSPPILFDGMTVATSH